MSLSNKNRLALLLNKLIRHLMTHPQALEL